MTRVRRGPPARPRGLLKSPSGIRGLDQVTGGGLPRGRPTLVCGGAGSGKTLLGMEFLVRGALDHGEPGVFLAFEERPSDLAKNTTSLGFDVAGLIARKKLIVDRITIQSAETIETGEYDLDGLFIRLGAAIDAIGAKRVVLDTIETLFSALADLRILRSELHRLFEWLKDRGVTTIVTGERGDGTVTRHGLEEYVSDCVILLDHRVTDQTATRRLRIVKYRGSFHGTNEYPFLIDDDGIVVLLITAVTLDHPASNEFVSTGLAKLDALVGGKGFFCGGVALVSGTAGTGKSSLAAHFVDAACRRGERCLYLAYEESAAQIARNMRSIGIDLERWIKRGLLRISAERPATFGLEMHVSRTLRLVDEFRPRIAVLDPVSSLLAAGSPADTRSMLMRKIDQLKSRQVTPMLTNLIDDGEGPARTSIGISSLIDTWLMLRNIEQDGERTRSLTVLKSRGMKHSNKVHELVFTSRGLDFEDAYVGPAGILVGSARLAQQALDRAQRETSRQDIERRKVSVERRRHLLDLRIGELEAEHENEVNDIGRAIRASEAREASIVARAPNATARQARRKQRGRHHAGGGTT